jgi:hypothetical protein
VEAPRWGGFQAPRALPRPPQMLQG